MGGPVALRFFNLFFIEHLCNAEPQNIILKSSNTYTVSPSKPFVCSIHVHSPGGVQQEHDMSKTTLPCIGQIAIRVIPHTLFQMIVVKRKIWVKERNCTDEADDRSEKRDEEDLLCNCSTKFAIQFILVGLVTTLHPARMH